VQGLGRLTRPRAARPATVRCSPRYVTTATALPGTERIEPVAVRDEIRPRRVKAHFSARSSRVHTVSEMAAAWQQTNPRRLWARRSIATSSAEKLQVATSASEKAVEARVQPVWARSRTGKAGRKWNARFGALESEQSPRVQNSPRRPFSPRLVFEGKPGATKANRLHGGTAHAAWRLPRPAHTRTWSRAARIEAGARERRAPLPHQRHVGSHRIRFGRSSKAMPARSLQRAD
jgi:hypothetical protein